MWPPDHETARNDTPVRSPSTPGTPAGRRGLLHWHLVSSVVLIGPADVLPALRARLEPGPGVVTFSDAEALEALDFIIRTTPRVIALEEGFSSSSRGGAFINRIEADPSLADCELRVLTPDTAGVVGRRASAAAAGSATAVAPPPPDILDRRGTRRAPRFRVRDGVSVIVDGNPTTLVDISTVGVQVLSPKMLKPNQRVRIALPDGSTAIRCHGSIAWASFEMPKGQPPRYRAGIDLTSGDVAAISSYTDKHKQ